MTKSPAQPHDHNIGNYNNYVAELEAVVAANGWALESNFRSRWCSFKLIDSRLVAFGIALDQQDTPYLYIKRVQGEASGFPANLITYNETHDQAEFALEPGVTRLEKFLPLFRLAYSRIQK